MAMAPKRKRVPLICQSCFEPENFDDMVNCGKCRKWSHFCCVGVGPKIVNEDWNCNGCKAAEMAKVNDDIANLNTGQKEIKEMVLEMKESNTATFSMFSQNMQKMNTLNVRENAVLQDQVQMLQVQNVHLESAFGAMKESNAPNVKESIPSNAFEMSMLPTKSLVELDDLLTYVQSVNGFTDFKLHISSFCGADVPTSVRNILFDVMDKDVQKLFSWSGLRTKKPSFAKKYKRIIDAIGETLNEKFKDYNYNMLKSKVKTLLQNAEY